MSCVWRQRQRMQTQPSTHLCTGRTRRWRPHRGRAKLEGHRSPNSNMAAGLPSPRQLLETREHSDGWRTDPLISLLRHQVNENKGFISGLTFIHKTQNSFKTSETFHMNPQNKVCFISFNKKMSSDHRRPGESLCWHKQLHLHTARCRSTARRPSPPPARCRARRCRSPDLHRCWSVRRP